MHGGVGTIVAGRPLDPALVAEDIEAVRQGCANLAAHVAIVRSFGLPVVVAINSFPTDTPAEVDVVREEAVGAGASDAVPTTLFADGGHGAEDLARAVWDAAQRGARFRLTYPDELPLREKIEVIATHIYGADGVDLAPAAVRALDTAQELGLGQLPICMAKTQYSLSHDGARKGRPCGFRLPIRDVQLRTGAGFVTPLAGDMRTMPGLPSRPAGERIDLDAAGEVVGLF
jgi:formyltetrahydrofolate synthetase